ncbi:MAG: hypothetical protein IPP57_02230 [Candidatus Obscuribacter sp.]|nr:hypothetical protein [Candidatus Obscuribacter sp.]
MLFNSLQYLVFLPTVFFLYWLIPQKFKVPLLLVASYVFYCSWRPIYGLLIFGLTLANFLLVPLIDKAAKSETGKHILNAKGWLSVVIAVNLILLGVFKYAYFTVDSIKVVSRWLALIGTNPICISFCLWVFRFSYLNLSTTPWKSTEANL